MEIRESFHDFYSKYKESESNNIWKQQSDQFKDFWNTRIMNGDHPLEDPEIDEIILFLDKKAKGSMPTNEAVANVMVPQGAWRRMFNHFKENESLRNALNLAMFSEDKESRITAINDLYGLNQGNKNNLTGKSISAINAFLAVSDPFNNLSIVSMNDRMKVIQFLGFSIHDFENMGQGERAVYSNELIVNYFNEDNLSSNARTISNFLYDSPVKDMWKNPSEIFDKPPDEDGKPGRNIGSYSEEQFIFYMENHLEDFLIENWDKTELGKKYELYEEDGELVSQQYRTDIGIIDILAKEKNTGAFVVIELKKGQTSDDTVGQIARYLGWIDEHKTKKSDTKGIIITGKYDKRLYYALKKIRDVEIFIYRVNFQLTEYKG